MKGKSWANIVLCLGILALLMAGIHKVSSTPDVSRLLIPELTLSERAAQMRAFVGIVEYGVELKKDSHLVNAIFSVENKSSKDVENIVIDCKIYAADDRDLGMTRWVIHDRVEALSVGTFGMSDERYLSKSATQVECVVTDLQVKKTPYRQGEGHTDDAVKEPGPVDTHASHDEHGEH